MNCTDSVTFQQLNKNNIRVCVCIYYHLIKIMIIPRLYVRFSQYDDTNESSTLSTQFLSFHSPVILMPLWCKFWIHSSRIISIIPVILWPPLAHHRFSINSLNIPFITTLNCQENVETSHHYRYCCFFVIGALKKIRWTRKKSKMNQSWDQLNINWINSFLFLSCVLFIASKK